MLPPYRSGEHVGQTYCKTTHNSIPSVSGEREGRVRTIAKYTVEGMCA